jgi:Ni,Fe-hydrogenase III small subunit
MPAKQFSRKAEQIQDAHKRQPNPKAAILIGDDALRIVRKSIGYAVRQISTPNTVKVSPINMASVSFCLD